MDKSYRGFENTRHNSKGPKDILKRPVKMKTGSSKEKQTNDFCVEMARSEMNLDMWKHPNWQRTCVDSQETIPLPFEDIWWYLKIFKDIEMFQLLLLCDTLWSASLIFLQVCSLFNRLETVDGYHPEAAVTGHHRSPPVTTGHWSLCPAVIDRMASLTTPPRCRHTMWPMWRCQNRCVKTDVLCMCYAC